MGEKFDTFLKARTNRLNVLPANPEEVNEDKAVGLGRFPSWLHRKMPKGLEIAKTESIVNSKRLHTVCEEAKCPNLLECWSKNTATFLVMGKECTRSCGFCSIDFSKQPKALEEDEPERVAQSVIELKLKHVVITMVARDDLDDGGASHLVKIVQVLREKAPETTVELLTSDFAGNQDAWELILNASPEILNYNIETVRSLTPRVRHKATYDRTLQLLSYAKINKKKPSMLIKSGLMVGLGESRGEVFETIVDLHKNGCDIITIGQYLQSNHNKLRVKRFVTPDEFKDYEQFGKNIGIPYMYCGPFVRSSYNAQVVIKEATEIKVIDHV